MAREISDGRKGLYYVGGVIQVIGGLCFLSTFITFLAHFGDFSNFEGNAKSDFGRAILGMLLLIAGGVVRGVGRAGLAGSGVVLDPQQAREELEPFSRQTGGMIHDAFEEVNPVLVGGGSQPAAPAQPVEVVKVRCQTCHALNAEAAKFCDQCGAAL